MWQKQPLRCNNNNSKQARTWLKRQNHLRKNSLRLKLRKPHSQLLLLLSSHNKSWRRWKLYCTQETPPLRKQWSNPSLIFTSALKQPKRAPSVTWPTLNGSMEQPLSCSQHQNQKLTQLTVKWPAMWTSTGNTQNLAFHRSLGTFKPNWSNKIPLVNQCQDLDWEWKILKWLHFMRQIQGLLCRDFSSTSSSLLIKRGMATGFSLREVRCMLT